MIRLFIRRPVAVSMLYLAVALLGVAAWRNLPLELLPDTRLPRLFVHAWWPGASPETTEAFLTAPIEAAIQQVRGVEKVESVSEDQGGAGTARITVEFARGTDMDFARLELSERLAALEDVLPGAARGPFVEPYVPPELREQSRPFLRYTVAGPYTPEALRAHVERVIAPELLRVDGVAAVQAQGGRGRLLEIELDPAKLHALGLSSDDVRARVEALEYVRDAGVVRGGGIERTVAIRQRAGSAAEVERLPLLADGRRIVRVRDVAIVHETHEAPRSYYRIDGQPAVSFEVHREVGSNAVRVADRVKASLATLAPRHPAGARLTVDDDESRAIRAQLTDLRYRALLAAAIVFLVLLLFLRSFRSAGIVFATIGFSILIALNLLYFGGFSLNVLTLMGLAMGFGLVVDNAIVVLESIYRRRRAGEPAGEAAQHGTRDVVLAIFASTVSTLVVFIPFVYLQGELRIYYVPLALVVAFSLAASLFVAFSFVPALAARALRVVPGVSSGDVAPPPTTPSLLARAYRALLRGTLRHPWLTVSVAVLLLGGSYYLFDKYVTRGALWRPWWEQQTYLDIRIRQPRGEELQRTDEMARYFEAKLRMVPEVARFVTNVSPRYAHIRVTFPDSLETTFVPVAIKEQMVAFSHLFGGAEVRVLGFGPSFYGGGGSPPTYTIKVLGYNYERVREIGEDLGRRLQRFSRIRDVDTNATRGWFERDRASELVLRLDRRRLALYGLSAREVVDQVGAAVQGEARGNVLRLGGEEVGFAVKLAGHERLDLLALQELLLAGRAGAGVRLGDIARIDERQVLGRVVREDQQYQRVVAYEFRGPTKLGDRVHEAVIGATRLPPGYTLVAREEWSWSEEEKTQIYVVLAIALVLIFMVCAALFESFRQPLCVLLTVPMALIGVFLLFFFTGGTFTREAYIGVIMMGGIAVNNAILLVDHMNRLRREHRLALEEAITRGALERARPILMTSTTTVLGVLPLVLFSESADSNIWNALGYALAGGLTSSALLVLTVTPALYLLFERRAARHAERKGPS